MRSFIRHPTDIPIEVITDPNEMMTDQPLSNVSLGGLAVRSDASLELGTLVRVRVSLVKPPFEAAGRVVWCREGEKGYDVGIEFAEQGDAFRARMVEQVCHIEQYRREVHEREGRALTGQEAAREWIGRYAADFPSGKSAAS
jgi:hypothetical protein